MYYTGAPLSIYSTPSFKIHSAAMSLLCQHQYPEASYTLLSHVLCLRLTKVSLPPAFGSSHLTAIANALIAIANA